MAFNLGSMFANKQGNISPLFAAIAGGLARDPMQVFNMIASHYRWREEEEEERREKEEARKERMTLYRLRYGPVELQKQKTGETASMLGYDKEAIDKLYETRPITTYSKDPGSLYKTLQKGKIVGSTEEGYKIQPIPFGTRSASEIIGDINTVIQNRMFGENDEYYEQLRSLRKGEIYKGPVEQLRIKDRAATRVADYYMENRNYGPFTAMKTAYEQVNLPVPLTLRKRALTEQANALGLKDANEKWFVNKGLGIEEAPTYKTEAAFRESINMTNEIVRRNPELKAQKGNIQKTIFERLTGLPHGTLVPPFIWERAAQARSGRPPKLGAVKRNYIKSKGNYDRAVAQLNQLRNNMDVWAKALSGGKFSREEQAAIDLTMKKDRAKLAELETQVPVLKDLYETYRDEFKAYYPEEYSVFVEGRRTTEGPREEVSLEEAERREAIGMAGMTPEEIGAAPSTPKEERERMPEIPREKGPGYFGTLERPDKYVSTELSISVNIDGEDMEMPLLVPTLTRDEIDHLLEGKKPTEKIVKKAIGHAKKRKKEGKSPFAQEGEQRPLPSLKGPAEEAIEPTKELKPKIPVKVKKGLKGKKKTEEVEAEKTIKFRWRGKIYNIPPELVGEFLKTHRGAKRL